MSLDSIHGSNANVVYDLCITVVTFSIEILWIPSTVSLSILELKQLAKTINVEPWLTYWPFLRGENERDFNFSFLFSVQSPISVFYLYFTEHLEGIGETSNKYPVFSEIKSFTTQHSRKSDFITCLYFFSLLPEPRFSCQLNAICLSQKFSLILNFETL